jgi:hypothetical protein
MEKEENRQWCSMTPLVCSIVPFGIAVGFVGLTYISRPEDGGCFPSSDEILWSLMPCCIGPLVALVVASMGTYGVLSGIAAIKEPWARGKILVAVGIVLGILDILIGIGYLFWILSNVFLRMR